MYELIDQIRNADQFNETFENVNEALSRANYEWNSMSKYDQDRRSDFYLINQETGDIVQVWK